MARRDDSHRRQALRSVEMVSYLGFAMAVPIAAGAWLGSLVDRKTGSSGIYSVLGIVLGVASGALSAYKIIMQVMAEDSSNATGKDNDRDE